MSVRRIGVLLSKELVWGPKNYLFIMAILAPLILSFLINLLVGTFFSGKPRLGISDAGQSQLVVESRRMEGLLLREYESDEAVKDAVARGAVDMGLTLPADFDAQIKSGDAAPLTIYVYGESLLKHRAFLATILLTQLRDLAGQESPVAITTETLGDGESIPWEDRLLPLIVLMTIFLGGSMVPATSLVEEKGRRTITAIITTPAYLEEMFVAKGVLGFLVSMTMGILILAINQAFGAQPLLLLVLMMLGATMASTFGVLLGALVKDINTLFATLKGMGIFLYAPAFLYLFPEIPGWIGRIFPTYYIIAPIVEVTQRWATLADIGLEVGVLLLLIMALLGALVYISRRARTRPTLLPGVVS